MSSLPGAYGQALGPDVPSVFGWSGASMAFGTVLQPGARVAAYVRSTGIQSLDHPDVAGNLVRTLAQGVARCREGKGDVVYVLPGHVETFGEDAFTDGIGIKSGTRIIGVGYGNLMPRLLIGEDAGIAVFANDVVFSGLAFEAVGTAEVGIWAVGDGVEVSRCRFVSSGADATFEAPVFVLGEGGARVLGNEMIWSGDASADMGIGVFASGMVEVTGNRIFGSALEALVGIISGADGTNVSMSHNHLIQMDPSAPAVVITEGFGDVVGMCSGNMLATGGGAGMTTTSSTVFFNENYTAVAAENSGVLDPPSE